MTDATAKPGSTRSWSVEPFLTFLLKSGSAWISVSYPYQGNVPNMDIAAPGEGELGQGNPDHGAVAHRHSNMSDQISGQRQQGRARRLDRQVHRQARGREGNRSAALCHAEFNWSPPCRPNLDILVRQKLTGAVRRERHALEALRGHHHADHAPPESRGRRALALILVDVLNAFCAEDAPCTARAATCRWSSRCCRNCTS